MTPFWSRTSSPSVAVAPGERVLASAAAADGTVLAGTRDAFYVRSGDETRRVPWEQVEAADWDRDTDTFRLSEVGTWGDQRPVHTAVLTEPGRLLELVRERVTASVVLQRHVPVSGRRGLRVIARRAPPGPAASSGSTSTTRASIPTTLPCARPPEPPSRPCAARSACPDFTRARAAC